MYILNNPDCKNEMDMLKNQHPAFIPDTTFKTPNPDFLLKNSLTTTLAPSSSKSRLKKASKQPRHDTDDSESPLQPLRSSTIRSRRMTIEDEDAMNHILNITKDARQCEYNTDHVYAKQTRKIKTNRIDKCEMLCDKPRSQSKTNVRPRDSGSVNRYILRNRDSLRLKEFI